MSFFLTGLFKGVKFAFKSAYRVSKMVFKGSKRLVKTIFNIGKKGIKKARVNKKLNNLRLSSATSLFKEVPTNNCTNYPKVKKTNLFVD